jgi:hypothetical protein
MSGSLQPGLGFASQQSPLHGPQSSGHELHVSPSSSEQTSSQHVGRQPGLGVPAQTPSDVQSQPSSQGAPSEPAVWTHPVSGSHVSVVHTLSSEQAAETSVCTQPAARLHESVVQASPSSQGIVVCTQKPDGSQVSSVQAS